VQNPFGAGSNTPHTGFGFDFDSTAMAMMDSKASFDSVL
jgi:hypothetical protein